MKHVVYLGIGSNVGDRIEFLAAAIRTIADAEMTVVTDVSQVYITEPVGGVAQNEFLNIAVCVRTDLDVESFHQKIKWIEHEIGRIESERWGPREIDIDILMFDHVEVSNDTLTIPHRELTYRRFVLQPFSDIAADVIHPVLQKTIKELRQETTDPHGVSYSESLTSQLFLLINDSITNPTV